MHVPCGLPMGLSGSFQLRLKEFPTFMPHSHDHSGHDHGHSHTPPSNNAAFAIGITLNVGFVVAEVVYGLAANSLALLSDAGHNLSD